MSEATPSHPTAPSPAAPIPAALSPAAPGSMGTRLLGAIYGAIGLSLLIALATRVFGEGMHAAVENSRLRLVIQLVSILIPAYPTLLGGWALVTGRKPPSSLNPLEAPFEPWWFETLGVLLWRELRAIFARPVAYICLFVFLGLNGLMFAALITYYTSLTMGNPERPASYFLTNNPVVLMCVLLLCPAITMRLLAEEQQAGTLESLLTVPVTHIQVVISKFAAALLFYGSMILVSTPYLLILKQFAPEWDWGPLLGGYLGLLLLGALVLSMGLFTSSITKSQVVAFVLATLPAAALFYITLYEWAIPVDWVRAVVRLVNIHMIQDEFSKGVVQSKTIVFYVSSCMFFLFLAVRGVESHRWR